MPHTPQTCDTHPDNYANENLHQLHPLVITFHCSLPFYCPTLQSYLLRCQSFLSLSGFLLFCSDATHLITHYV